MDTPSHHWRTSRFDIDLSHPKVMGIVNVTPDSFSDGGRHGTAAQAMAHCEALLAQGAHILDIGGESTRPGARALGLEEEAERVLPVVKHALSLGCPVSVDTSKAELMARVLDLGADIINDVAALRLPGALDVVAAHPRCGVCLMHMQGTPQTMQDQTDYVDVVAEVRDFLAARAQVLRERGVSADRITLDPGIGFGKTSAHNLALLPGQAALLALGYPVLAGWSRKGTLGKITGREVGERMVASVAAALAAVQYGARIVRVHDVAPTVDALNVWCAAGLC